MNTSLPQYQACQQILTEGLQAQGVPMDAGQIEKLLNFLQLLHKWNRAYNLTAVRDPLAMVSRHLLDSLSISEYLTGDRIIDVGTGPGLPGIPLAIRYPDKQFTLLDSNGKRTRFLQQVKIELQLDNIEIFHGRVEQHRPQSRYQAVLSRAFASLQDMLTWTQGICADDGCFLAMKGVYPDQELALLPEGYRLAESHRLLVPGEDGERHLIVIKRAG